MLAVDITLQERRERGWERDGGVQLHWFCALISILGYTSISLDRQFQIVLYYQRSIGP